MSLANVQSNLLGEIEILPGHMWNLLRPRIKPMYPALADRFLMTGPPGNSLTTLLWNILIERRKEH